jgi:predicted transcriptional regulator
VLESNNTKKSITEFEKLISDTKSPTENDIENLVNNFNRIVYDAAGQSLKKMNGTRKRKINNKNKKCRSNNHQKWYDSSLINFKRNLDDRLNLLLKYDRDPQVRSQYFSSLKQYRKLRKMKSLQYRQEIINKLDSLYESNPKEYWKLLDQLKSKDNSFSEDASHVPENEWYDYFKHLNEDTFTDKKIDKLLNDLEKDKIFNELDYIISEEEILKAIKDLKNNKAAGFYIIINEMRSVSIGKTIVQIV